MRFDFLFSAHSSRSSALAYVEWWITELNLSFFLGFVFPFDYLALALLAIYRERLAFSARPMLIRSWLEGAFRVSSTPVVYVHHHSLYPGWVLSLYQVE